MKLLVSADWHVRGDTPKCRTDADWIEHQRACIREIFDLALAEDVDMRVVGDIFHTARIATEALCMVVEEFQRFLSLGGRVKILAGNHDLKFHQYDLVGESSFGVLRALVPEIGPDESTDAAPFSLDNPTGAEFAFTHQLVFPDKESIPPGCEARVASEILKQFPSRFVFTGDYHHAFTADAPDGWGPQKLQRTLVNPGCINRQSADMEDYKPRVAIVDTDKNAPVRIQWHFLHADIAKPDLVSRAHLDAQEERDERIEAFVELLRSKGAISFSFMDNLDAKRKFASKGVQEVLHEIIQKSKEIA